MNIVKNMAREQYQGIVNYAAGQLRSVKIPKEGWVAAVRKALGMSGAQLARRLDVSRAQVTKTEQGELAGTVTLNTMQSMAQAMGCRFVYAIVPEGRIEDILMERAAVKSERRVKTAGTHAALEDQALSKEQMAREIERLTDQLLRDMPPDFWNDEG